MFTIVMSYIAFLGGYLFGTVWTGFFSDKYLKDNDTDK